MQESSRARDALLRFYDAFTEAVAGDMESFDRVFSREENLLVIGSAYHEWVDSREKGKGAWGMEGIRLEAGDPRVLGRRPRRGRGGERRRVERGYVVALTARLRSSASSASLIRARTSRAPTLSATCSGLVAPKSTLATR